jgi:hypothetical protein
VKVFLGGTCGDTKWREILIPMLKIKYFDPRVKDWNDEARRIEEQEKDSSDYHLYVITPAMTGVYSIAEVINSCYRNKATIFCFIQHESQYSFTRHQVKSLEAVGHMVSSLGGFWAPDLESAADFMNSKATGFIMGQEVESS